MKKTVLEPSPPSGTGAISIGVTKVKTKTVVHKANRHNPSAASTVVSAAYIQAIDPLEF